MIARSDLVVVVLLPAILEAGLQIERRVIANDLERHAVAVRALRRRHRADDVGRVLDAVVVDLGDHVADASRKSTLIDVPKYERSAGVSDMTSRRGVRGPDDRSQVCSSISVGRLAHIAGYSRAPLRSTKLECSVGSCGMGVLYAPCFEYSSSSRSPRAAVRHRRSRNHLLRRR